MSTVDDGSPMDGVVSGGNVTFVVVLVVAALASLSRARSYATVIVTPARVSAMIAPRRAETIGSTYLRVTWRMIDDVQATVSKDPTIDITTTGRHSGDARRIEIWMLVIEDRFFITGTPGPRGWLANVAERPSRRRARQERHAS